MKSRNSGKRRRRLEMLISARSTFWKIISVGLLLVAGTLGCAGLQERPGVSTPAACLVISPISGLPATAITIRGSGFVPGEKIEVIMVVDGVPTDLGEKPMIKEANELGGFKTTSAIPPQAKPGVYTVKATGDKGTMAVAPLEVEEKPEKKK
jgi:hypothetical protein